MTLLLPLGVDCPVPLPMLSKEMLRLLGCLGVRGTLCCNCNTALPGLCCVFRASTRKLTCHNRCCLCPVEPAGESRKLVLVSVFSPNVSKHVRERLTSCRRTKVETASAPSVHHAILAAVLPAPCLYPTHLQCCHCSASSAVGSTAAGPSASS